MSNRTREINKITTTIISISVKLIVYALVILLLYEAVVRGYEFGHDIFYAEAVDEAPGRDVMVWIDQNETVSQAAKVLERKGLIKSEFAFIFQSKFYDCETIYPGTYNLNTSMTSKEILQLLNEKPEEEDEAQPVQSDKAKAGRTAEGSGSSSKENFGEETRAGEAASAAEEGGRSVPEPQGEDGQARDSRANAQTYEGEEQQEEGGWIEDVTEGQLNDSE